MRKKENNNKKSYKHIKRRIFIIIGFISIFFGFLSMSFVGFTANKNNNNNIKTHQRSKNTPSQSNSQIPPTTSPEDSNNMVGAPVKTDSIFYLDLSNLPDLTQFSNAQTIYRKVITIQANNGKKLVEAYPDFGKWAQDMFIKPLLDPSISRKAKYFTPDIANKFYKEFNSIYSGKKLPSGKTINVVKPKDRIDVLTGTTQNYETNKGFQMKVAEFQTRNAGIGILGVKYTANGKMFNSSLIINNKDKRLDTGNVAQDIEKGNIYFRANSGSAPMAQGEDVNSVLEIKKEKVGGYNVMSVYVNLVGDIRGVNVWSEAISGMGSSPIKDLKLGEQEISKPTDTITAGTSVPVYAENMKPKTTKVANTENITFWLKKGEYLNSKLKVNGEDVYNYGSFVFGYKDEASGVNIYEDLKMSKKMTDFQIGDIAWGTAGKDAGQPGGKYEFKFKYSLTTDKEFAKVEITYRSDIFQLSDINNKIDLGDEPNNYNYQGVFFRNPSKVSYSPAVDKSYISNKKIDPNKLAKLALSEVLEQWTGLDRGLTLSKSLDMTYQGITTDAGKPGGVDIDGVVQKLTNLKGSDIYSKYLNDQYALLFNTIKNNNIPGTIHSKNDKPDYYKMEISPTHTTLQFLQSKFIDNLDGRSEAEIAAVTTIVKNYKDVTQITASEILKIEKQLTMLVQKTILQNFSTFKALLYTKVFKAYGVLLESSAYGAPKLLPTDLLSQATGDLKKDTAAFTINNTKLVTSKTSDKYGTQIANSITGFVSKYNFGKTIFNDNPKTLAIYNKMAENNFNPMTDASQFENVQNNPSNLKDSQNTFKLYDSLFTWLDIPVNDILGKALDKSVVQADIEKDLGANLQMVITKLIDINNKNESAKIYSKVYKSSKLQTIVANNNIRTALNSIDLNGKSAVYVRAITDLKNTDWKNITEAKQYATATENFDLTKYINNFTNGSKTQEYIDQIKKLNFENPKIFNEPDPTPLFKKALGYAELVMEVVFLVAGVGMIVSIGYTLIKSKNQSDGAVTTNEFNRKLIKIISIFIIVIAVLVIIFTVAYMAGLLGSGIPFVK